MNNPNRGAFLYTIFSCFLITNLFSQATSNHVFEEWANNKGVNTQIFKSSTRRDWSGNVIVAGGTFNVSGNYDWLITKYNRKGQQLWSVTYNGPGNSDDYIADIDIDFSGNIYVTGVVTTDTAQGWDVGVAKYNSSGVMQWISTYDNGQSYPFNKDGGTAIDHDPWTGNIYVAGGSDDAGSGSDFVTLKFNNSGTQQWVNRYDYVGLHDLPAKIRIFASSLVVVTGAVQRTTTKWRTHAIIYGSSGGTLFNYTPSPTYADDMDEIRDVTQDDDGNIYVTGYIYNLPTGKDLKIIKLTDNLTLQWTVTYDGVDHLDDEGRGIRVDDSGNVYVTGYTTTGTEGRNMVLQKYNSTGVLQWTKKYNGAENGNDGANALLIDDNQNPIITGYSQREFNLDYCTIKYDPSGNLEWEIRYNGVSNKDDIAEVISKDDQGSIYVTGQSQDTSGINSKYITVKYVETELYNLTDTSEVPSTFDVTPNLGQLLNADGLTTENTTIRYYTPSLSTYFENTKVIHLFSLVNDTSLVVDTITRVDMTLANDVSRTVFAYEKQNWYSNYYLPQTQETNGLTNVPIYQKLVYPEIYKFVDLEVSANYRGIKNNFVVKQGGNTSSIAFVFSGMDSLYIDNEDLVIATISDTLSYKRPIVSQIDSSGGYVSLPWQPVYKIQNDTVTFDSVQTYNTNLALVIEMNQGSHIPPVIGGDNLDWSTYYNTTSEDAIYDVDANDQGSKFITGHANNANIPTHAGVFTANSSVFGSYDAYYTKFNDQEHIVHRTYYGGSGNDMAFSIGSPDDISNIVFAGVTESSDLANFATGGNLNDNTLNGACDGFIVMVDQTGTNMVIDTYYGGDGDDGGAKVSIAGTHIIVGGNTSSGTNFPNLVLPGAYNQSYKGGNEGFLMKIDGINQIWSTFIGGDDDDLLEDVMVEIMNADGTPRIAAYLSTRTTTGTVVTSPASSETPDGSLLLTNFGGAYTQNTFNGGGVDGYVVYFDDFNRIEWSTYFGTNVNDVSSIGISYPLTFFDDGNCGINIDKEGRIVLVGGLYSPNGTASITGIPFNTITPSTYSQTAFSVDDNPPDGFNIYLSKFENDHSLVWYTMFGGTGRTNHNYPTDVITDESGNIFVTGSEVASTPQGPGNYCTVPTLGEFPICDAITAAYLETDGPTTIIWRTFIAAFNQNGEIQWSTRYGMPQYNCAQGLDIGKQGSNRFLYLAGWSGNSNYTLRDIPGTQDWYWPTWGGGGSGFDGTMARFHLDADIIGIPNEPSNDSELIVYPNPTSGQLQLSIAASDVEEILIINANGQVLTKITNFNEGDYINVATLSNGIYVIKVCTKGNNWYYSKFVKI